MSHLKRAWEGPAPGNVGVNGAGRSGGGGGRRAAAAAPAYLSPVWQDIKATPEEVAEFGEYAAKPRSAPLGKNGFKKAIAAMNMGSQEAEEALIRPDIPAHRNLYAWNSVCRGKFVLNKTSYPEDLIARPPPPPAAEEPPAPDAGGEDAAAPRAGKRARA